METIDVSKMRDYFAELTFRHLSYCIKAFDMGEFFSSTVWAAVFVEALLKDMLFELDGRHCVSDLKTLVFNLNEYVFAQDNGISQSDRNLFRDIANRCTEIRVKRNRLVHDTGVERGSIDHDARDINSNVMQIVNQYVKTSVGERIYARNSRPAAESDTVVQKPPFPIFISTITPHAFEQREFLSAFCKSLEKLGVKPVRCVFDDFDKKDPISKVKHMIAECKAFIVIGLERSHVYFYRDKEGSLEEKEATHRKYTSGWLQIESGIATAMNKPIFVLCQKDIFSDGIFDRGWNTYEPIEIDTPLDINHPKVQLVLQKIKELVDTYEE